MTIEQHQQILQLVEQEKTSEAIELLDELSPEEQADVDVQVTRAAISIQTLDYDNALSILNEAVLQNPDHPVALLMLAGVLARLDRTEDALEIYEAIKKVATDPWTAEADRGIEALKNRTSRCKVAIICAQGMDSFIRPIQTGLGKIYQFKLYTVASLKDVQDAMDWADICWFEWCDDLLIRSSNQLRKSCSVVCRLHSYEVFETAPVRVNWEFVDQLVFVSEHVKNIFEARVDTTVNKTLLHNGIDLPNLKFAERSRSRSLAYLGFVNFKKNPAFLLQIMARLAKIDPAYTLHVGGTFQDLRFKIYFDHMIRTLGLSDNIIFDGWIDDVDEWLDDKDYILSTSIFESFGVSIAQGMAKGLKPIVHNWPGASSVYPEEMLFATLDEAVDMIVSEDVQSAAYREYIDRKYSLESQLRKVDELLRSLVGALEVAEAA